MSRTMKKQLDELRNMLLEEKKELELHFKINHESENGLRESLRVSTGELSTADNHPADLGTEVFERGRDIAVDENMERQLNEVNQALARMEKGEYGKCLACGKQIPFGRLEALPYTAYCVEHTPEQNISERRPIEEQVITRPPSGAGMNRQEQVGQFDDADAWQSVESFGSSNSPAMAADREVRSYESDEGEALLEIKGLDPKDDNSK